MQKSIRMGENRTGIATSPIDSRAQVELAERQPVEASDGAALAIGRSSIEEADPVGTIPPPASAKGAAKSLAKKLTGRRPEMLVNKLGERLAYERSGTRLYDALIVKCSTAAVASELSLEELHRFRQQEAQSPCSNGRSKSSALILPRRRRTPTCPVSPQWACRRSSAIRAPPSPNVSRRCWSQS